jgi:ribosomal protein L7/L12
MKKFYKVLRILKIVGPFIVLTSILLFMNGLVSGKVNNGKEEWNQLALSHLTETYGETKGFKEQYVSISEWKEISNNLAQEVIDSEQEKVKTMSQEITDKTIELVTLRDEFSSVSLETAKVIAEMEKVNIPEEVKTLVTDHYNKKLSQSSSKVDGVSKSILDLSKKVNEPVDIYYPEKIAYAKVTIAFDGKLLGFKKKEFPILIDTEKNEILSADEYMNTYTAVNQIVETQHSITKASGLKALMVILLVIVLGSLGAIIGRPFFSRGQQSAM